MKKHELNKMFDQFYLKQIEGRFFYENENVFNEGYNIAIMKSWEKNGEIKEFILDLLK